MMHTTPNIAKPKLHLIAAMAQQRVIGHQGRMPWHSPEDLAHFKALTSGHTIIMGRKTFDSLGRLLPNRRHIVITRQTDWTHEGVMVAANLFDACTPARARAARLQIVQKSLDSAPK